MTTRRFNHLISIVAVACTASCGGGGGGSGSPAPVSSTTPIQSANIVGKAIDGYISGAKVFVDMNWSLAHEAGEPSTTTDASGNWTFTADSLKDFACFKSASDGRPIIVEVPVGAVDSDRGVVKAAFRLIYLPSAWLGIATTSNVANISPFTTLFTNAITDAFSTLTTNEATSVITVENSCGSTAELIESKVKVQVEDLGKRFKDAGVDFSKFYDDYISTKDEDARKKGEFIVDLLAKTQEVSDLIVASIQQEVGASGKLRSKYALNFDVIKSIVSGTPKSVAFDIGVYTLGLQLPSGESALLFYQAKGLRLRTDGALLASSCTNDDPFGCVPITVRSSDEAIKSSSYINKTISIATNRGLFFTKNKKNNLFDCEQRFVYSYEPQLGAVTSTVVSQLEFTFKAPIAEKKARYDCDTGDEGVTFTKKFSYPPRANGYFYSLLRYFGSKDSVVVTRNLPYATDYISKNIIQTPFDSAKANAELNALPSKPTELDSIIKNLPGTWYLQTGSKEEDANLTYMASTNTFKCQVKKYNSNEELRKVEGTKDQALAMCYPDLSVFN